MAELSACSKSFPNHGFIENLRVPDCLHVLITLQDNGPLQQLQLLRILLQQRLLKKYFHLPDRLQQLRHEKLIFYPRVVPQWTQNLPAFTILTLLTDEISHLPQKNATHDAKVNFLPQNSKHWMSCKLIELVSFDILDINITPQQFSYARYYYLLDIVGYSWHGYS